MMMLRALAFLLFFSLLGCGSTTDTEQSIPDTNFAEIRVLNYYPNCPYHVMDEVDGYSGISAAEHQQLRSNPRSTDESAKLAENSFAEAVQQLKLKAAQLGADAIAIKDYNTTNLRIRTSENRTIKAQRHRLKAEAIVLCESDRSATTIAGSKLTNYNANGESNLSLLASANIAVPDRNNLEGVVQPSDNQKVTEQLAQTQLKTERTAPRKLTSRKVVPRRQATTIPNPVVKSTLAVGQQAINAVASSSSTSSDQLASDNIDVNGDILGAKLGWNKQQVVSLMGQPSATIRISGKQSAFFYGRKHLFLFDRDTLVGYEHSDWLLPLHLSNRIPLNDALYGAQITIDEELAIGSTLSEVSEALYLKAPILRYNMLRIQGRKSLTRLHFRAEGEFAEKDKTLKGISIYQKGYQEFDWQSVVALSKSKTFIDLSEGLLDSKSKISKEDVVETLGLPTLTIAKPRNKDIWIYGNSLIVDFVRGNMIKYTLESSKHQSQHRPCTQCLYVGQPRTEIPNQFVTQRTQRQLTLESKGFSYLVSLSEDSIPKVDDVQAFIKR